MYSRLLYQRKKIKRGIRNEQREIQSFGKIRISMEECKGGNYPIKTRKLTSHKRSYTNVNGSCENVPVPSFHYIKVLLLYKIGVN